ncbi:leucine zipper domain-containing protein [Streptomyces sp. NPDC002589]|uniref:leucine zipper domain-containing protein n=1 Tax=Streptomyces sp. NPDC002589 TaxID=3154420 RepID=UPI003318B1DE
MLEQVRAFWARCGLRHLHADRQEALVSHRNAPLTPTGRLRLARCVVDDGWPVRRAAERFQVSHTTSHAGPRPRSRNRSCACAANRRSDQPARPPAATSPPPPPTAS